MYGIKVDRSDLDVADVDRADGYHAEETVSLASKYGDAFLEDEEVLQAFGHLG